MSDVEGVESKPRWGLILGVTLLGAVVVAAPFLLSQRVNAAFGSWRSLMASTLTNVGTTFLLAALLVWVERRFIAKAERTARRVVDEKTEGFRQDTADIRQRLEALQDRVAQRTASAEAAGAGIVDEIVSDVSFETVTRALELANDVSALWSSSVTVPMNDAVDAPALNFSWTAAQQGGKFDSLDNLVAKLRLVYIHHPGESNLHVEVEWERDAQTDEVMHQLTERMVRAEFGRSAKTLNAEYMFERFSRGIADAIAGRRASDESWLTDCGKLDELVGPNLAITSRGIAAAGHGLAFAAREFPERSPGWAVRMAGRDDAYELPSPPPPDGIDAAHWSVAISRAARLHTRISGGGSASGWAAGAGPIPITSENTPRRQ